MESNEALDHFIEKFAVSSEAEGMPRIAGRIVGLFTLHAGPLSFSEIASRLGVSRASVSTNLRLVRDRGIVELVSRPGDRQDYYQLASDPYRSTLRRSLIHIQNMEKLARETAAVVGDSSPETQRRLMHMVKVHETAYVHVKALLEALYGAQP